MAAAQVRFLSGRFAAARLGRAGRFAWPPAGTAGPLLASGPEFSTLAPTIGQTLTWTGPGFTAAGGGSIAITQDILAGSAEIPAPAAEYTPVPADDLTVLSLRAGATETGGSADGSFGPATWPIGQVRWPAPVAAGGLADRVFTAGAEIAPVDLAADFTGGGLSYALAPASAALPPGLSLSAAGLLAGIPASPAGPAVIVVRGTSSGGHADSAFELTVSAAATLSALTAGTQSGDMPFGYTVDLPTVAAFVVLPAAAPAPDAAQIGAGTDGSGTPALDHFEASLDLSGDPVIVTLASDIDQDVKVYGVAAGSADVAATDAFALDTRVPGLSAPGGTATGETTADLSVATDETEGEVFVIVLPSGDSAPAFDPDTGWSVSGVFEDSDAAPASPATFAATGLTPGTGYRAHYCQVDEQGNVSGVATGAAFTTDAAVSFDGLTYVGTMTGDPAGWSTALPDPEAGRRVYLLLCGRGNPPLAAPQITLGGDTRDPVDAALEARATVFLFEFPNEADTSAAVSLSASNLGFNSVQCHVYRAANSEIAATATATANSTSPVEANADVAAGDSVLVGVATESVASGQITLVGAGQDYQGLISSGNAGACGHSDGAPAATPRLMGMSTGDTSNRVAVLSAVIREAV